jgi:nickel-dependent lactate racemase
VGFLLLQPYNNAGPFFEDVKVRAGIAWGQTHLEIDIDEANLVPAQRAPIAPNVADPIQAIRDALEHPLDYPALRRALTPDDHVAVVVDEGIPNLGRLLTPLLEHIGQAHVHPEAITLVCPPGSVGQSWLDDLPDEFQDVQIEVHQPTDRKKLAYLATTKQGRRVYLNRTAVDSDQLVLFTRRRYDVQLGCYGAETALFPTLSDEEAIEEFRTNLHSRAPGDRLWSVQQEARDIVWLSGAPFLVQIIEGAGDGIAHVLAGPLESSDEGRQLLDDRWRVAFDRAADVVIASVTGDATMDDLARAFLSASRVVKPGGSVAVLSDAAPPLGPGMEQFRRHEDPELLLNLLYQEKPIDLTTAFQWATAAQQARLYLLSGLPEDVAEELFTIPMQHAGQVQRLLTPDATCILLPDAHRAMAEIT